MTATEELRRLLDERGVEWWQSANTLGCVFTRWYSPLFGDEVCAMENGEEGLVLFDHFVTPEQAIAATLGSREQPPYDELIESLRRDWGIDASWDGLRRFWSIGLTEDGCLMRDRACKAEAENAKLREEIEAAKHDLQVFSANLARLGAENASLEDVLHEVEGEAVFAFNSLRQDCETITDSSQHFFEKWWHAECEVDRLKAENSELRELVADMWLQLLNAYDRKEVDEFVDRMHELGVDA